MVDYQIYWSQIVWVVAAPFEMWIVPSRWPNPKNDLGHLSWRNGKRDHAMPCSWIHDD